MKSKVFRRLILATAIVLCSLVALPRPAKAYIACVSAGGCTTCDVYSDVDGSYQGSARWGNCLN